MKFIKAVLLAIAVSFVSSAAAQVAPTLPSSFQPSVQFARGEGDGYAYEYWNRTKAQIIAILRNPELAKKAMRVTCDVLVRQMAETHPGYPFEGCEGTAKALESDDFVLVTCQNKMFEKDNRLAVTNSKATKFGSWPRKCYEHEKVLVHKSGPNKPLLSAFCLNPVIPGVLAVPVAPPQAATKPPAPTVAPSLIPQPLPPLLVNACQPGEYTIVFDAWDWNRVALVNDLASEVAQLVEVADARESKNATNPKGYTTDSVSAQLGGRLRREVRERAPVDDLLFIQLRDPDSFEIVEKVGTVRLVKGVASMTFNDEQRNYVIEALWPERYLSPTVSGGSRRLVHKPEWWNRGKCLHMHGILKLD